MPVIGIAHLISRLALGGTLTILVIGATQAAPDWVAAKADMRAPQISGFAGVQSNSVITISPSQAGIVTGINVVPGQSIAAGEIIARVGGPLIAAATVQAETTLTSAQAAQRAAEISLTAEQQKMEQRLSTHDAIAQATSALAAATAQAATAQANLDALRRTAELRSPLSGVVQTVAVANGDVLAAGQAVATIQPETGTWLKAVFYGLSLSDLSATAAGRFIPASGGTPVEVKVRGALAVSQADGGVPVAIVTTQPLAPGAFGTVTLSLPKQPVTLVPTEALILDKGRWWVMVHDSQGEHPVEVMPGPAEGYETVIKSGLKPGDDVVVVNAYLLYHRGIAAIYQPPD